MCDVPCDVPCRPLATPARANQKTKTKTVTMPSGTGPEPNPSKKDIKKRDVTAMSDGAELNPKKDIKKRCVSVVSDGSELNPDKKDIKKRGATAVSDGSELNPDKKIRKRSGPTSSTWDLTLGTDFSGMDTPVQSLTNAGFKVNQRFRCEKNPSCRKLLEYMRPNDGSFFDFKDIRKRAPADAPYVDLYVAGVPCAPWSTDGPQLGLADPNGRLWVNSLEYVQERKPKVAVFENVKGITQRKFSNVFDSIITTLEANYKVWYKVLNTAEHGIPQHRERLYIVAVRRDMVLKNKEFEWPEPLQHCMSLKKLLSIDNRPIQFGIPPANMEGGRAKPMAIQACMDVVKKNKDFNINENILVVDVGCTEKRASYMVDMFPTVTASRASSGGWWSVNHGGKVALKHMFLLQGTFMSCYPFRGAGVSETRMAHMVGNAMSGNVLERLLPRALRMAGIFPSTQVCDPWPAFAEKYS